MVPDSGMARMGPFRCYISSKNGKVLSTALSCLTTLPYFDV